MNKRFVMLCKTLRSTVGRVLTGVSCLCALAWLLWPKDHWKLEPDALGAFIVTLLTWIASETPISLQMPSNHDKELFKKFAETLPSPEIDFLRNHDFGGSFFISNLHGIRELSHWGGVNYEFDDTRIERDFQTLKVSITEFSNELASNSWSINSSGLYSCHTNHDQIEGVSRNTYARIKSLNNQATKLVIQIEEFIRITRGKVNQ